MRKSLFYLTAFIVLAVGCNKENGPEDGQTGGVQTPKYQLQ